jgi:hypothetical protein
VFEQKIGVKGSLVSENYLLTRLTCSVGRNSIELMLPIDWGYAMSHADTTYRITENGLKLTFQVGNEKLDKIVSPSPIMDRSSALDKGTVLSVHHGDRIWKALIALDRDKLIALTGGYGEFESVFDNANLREFEKICGLKR